jgi:hypothetical protein
MTVANGAGADDQQQVDGQDGSGAPSGGSPEGGSGKKGDEEFVPVSQLKAALKDQGERYQREIGGLRAEFDAFKAGVGTGGNARDDDSRQAKRYSKAELKAAVAAEQISQDQMDDIWERQIKAEAVAEATKAATDAVTRKATQESVDGDIARYSQLAPEILDEGSDERKRVREEFTYLVSKGQPRNVATELLAIRAVLGPLDKLERARSARRSEEHHQDVGGGGGGGERKPKGGAALTYDSLTPREKAHYDKNMGPGKLYADKAAVNEELKFANTRIRAKYGARA